VFVARKRTIRILTIIYGGVPSLSYYLLESHPNIIMARFDVFPDPGIGV
jgi:hypothetical protein